MTILAKDCHVKLNGESVYLHGWHVTDFLSNFCMFAYQWHCMTMWTCNILIVIQKLCWWRSTIWPYQPHSYMSFTLLWRCRDGWGFVYFPSLPSLFCVLLVCHLYNSFQYVALPLHFPPLLEYPSIFEVNAKCFEALFIYTSCKNYYPKKFTRGWANWGQFI